VHAWWGAPRDLPAIAEIGYNAASVWNFWPMWVYLLFVGPQVILFLRCPLTVIADLNRLSIVHGSNGLVSECYENGA
jgi:hypothetical protein